MDNLYSHQLIQKRNSLIKQFLKQREPQFLVGLTRIMDEYFQAVFAASDTARTMEKIGRASCRERV